MTYDLAGANILSPSRKISKVYTEKDERTISIVFDESPCHTNDITNRILNILDEYKIESSFLVYGDISSHSLQVPKFLGGVKENPELLIKIFKQKHGIILEGGTIPSTGEKFFTRKKIFPNAIDYYYDICKFSKLIKELTDDKIALVSPPSKVWRFKDGKTTLDVLSAIPSQQIGFAHEYARAFVSNIPVKDAGKKIIRQFSESLAYDINYYSGKIIRLMGGPDRINQDCPTIYALPEVLNLLQRAGYKFMSVKRMISNKPFLDVGPENKSFESARSLLNAGQTICYRNNKLNLAKHVIRCELYASLIPPAIMLDYMQSRLFNKTAEFDINIRSEKEFLMMPGRAVSAGMLYAYSIGLPITGKFNVISVKEFGTLLEKIACGKTVLWDAPDKKELVREDIFNVLEQVLL